MFWLIRSFQWHADLIGLFLGKFGQLHADFFQIRPGNDGVHGWGTALQWPCRVAYFEAVSDVTRILERVEQGDPKAAGELLPLVYDELRRLAAHRLANEPSQHTLQPTALVHEAWLKISGDAHRDWSGRQHFFAAAAEAMRRILVDRARRRLAAKRGAGEACLDADDLAIAAPSPDDQLLAVSDALDKFAQVESRKAELVKLRYFVGMTFEEASAALGIAVPTAKQWWAYARAWLRVEIGNTLPVESSAR